MDTFAFNVQICKLLFLDLYNVLIIIVLRTLYFHWDILINRLFVFNIVYNVSKKFFILSAEPLFKIRLGRKSYSVTINIIFVSAINIIDIGIEGTPE